MKSQNEIRTAQVLGAAPSDYVALEVRGVRFTGEEIEGRKEVIVDDKNPDIYSHYLVHKDGRSIVTADFDILEPAVIYGTDLARQFNLRFRNAFVESNTFESHNYADQVINDRPENFRGVEVEGARETNGTITVDNQNPEFFTTYLRHMDGRALAAGDFATADEAKVAGKKLADGYADAYGWTFTSSV